MLNIIHSKNSQKRILNNEKKNVSTYKLESGDVPLPP